MKRTTFTRARKQSCYLSDAKERADHDRMVELVVRILSPHHELQSARTAHEKTVLQRQIDATDRQINRLVYGLYGLSEEEIAIVEEATGS